MLSVFVMKNIIGCDWIVCMYLYAVYGCMYRITNGRFEVRSFVIEDNHTTAGWSNTPDAYFTELSFEAPRASVIFILR